MKYEHKFPTFMTAAGLAALLILPTLGFAHSMCSAQTLGSAASYAVLAG